LSGVRFDNRGAIDVPDRIREYDLDLVRFRARMMAIERVLREYPWSAKELLENASVE
jgi:hypothetical protein